MSLITSTRTPILPITLWSLVCCMMWQPLRLVAQGSQQVYRCGNAYTNQPEPSQRCTPLSQANVTVIEGTKVQASAPNHSPSTTRVDPSEQSQRDAQAKLVLESELQKAQTRQAELLSEWQQGEPQRRADEAKQAAKYQARVEQLRQSLERGQADIAGLERELARLRANPNGVKP